MIESGAIKRAALTSHLIFHVSYFGGRQLGDEGVTLLRRGMSKNAFVSHAAAFAAIGLERMIVARVHCRWA
jgi:hypothetical protein